MAEQQDARPRVKRDAFLYLDPKGDKKNFAQCGTCMMFTGSSCTIHGKDVEISSDMSCGFYVSGTPHTNMKGKEMKAVTPKESGLYKGKVRCENCLHVDAGTWTCNFFEKLNASIPALVSLDIKIQAQGCCNAFTQKDQEP